MCVICNNDKIDNVEKLYIQICPYIKRLPEIKNVKWLEIIQCKNLEYIPKIDGLLVLVVIGCPNITELPYMESLKGLKLQCKKLKYIHSYENLEKLELHNENIYEIPYFPKLNYLYLNHINSLYLPSYPNLYELQIHNCRKMITIGIYHNLSRLIIQSCSNILSTDNIAKTIENSPNMTNSYIINSNFINNIYIRGDEENLENVELNNVGKTLKNFIKLIECKNKKN